MPFQPGRAQPLGQFGVRLIPPPARPTPADYVPAFATVFRWTIPFMVLALVLALAMPDKPLSEEMIEAAQGKAEVPEY